MIVTDPSAVRVPHEDLSPEAFDRVVREFVLREGTDYGQRLFTLDEKVDAVKREVRAGRAVITFDLNLESCSVVSVNEVAAHDQAQTLV